MPFKSSHLLIVCLVSIFINNIITQSSNITHTALKQTDNHIQENIIQLEQPVPLNNQYTTAYGQITIDQFGAPHAQLYAPNCAEYINGICTKCSFRFIRASDGVCEPVNPLCSTWDSNGACLTCYPGYEVCQNGCIMTQSRAPSGTYDPNCRNTINGICQQCSISYYFNQNGICTQISPFCKSSDNQSNCLSCYAGYVLNTGNCTVLSDPAINNPYCTRFVNNVCKQCSNSSWNNGQKCIPLDPMCSRTDNINGNCLSCYAGYILSIGKCILDNNTKPSDLLCRRWNLAGVCVQCSNHAFLKQNMCVSVDSLCNTFQKQNGNCLSCYFGYNLSNGKCVIVPPNEMYESTNKYCSVWQGSVCQQCAKNTYLNTHKICTPMNQYCASSSQSGVCLSCYNGFILRNNNCTVENTTINISNALCSIWSGQTCQQCATRTYNFNGVCRAVNTLCSTWNSQNGNCLTCYNGYLLNGNICVLNDQAVTGNPLCKTFNGATCVECANRAYFLNGICTSINTSCATWNQNNGRCTACYNGFALQNGGCVALPPSPAPTANFDIFCARTNSTGTCIRCFFGFTLTNGACVADFKNTACAKDPASCK